MLAIIITQFNRTSVRFVDTLTFSKTKLIASCVLWTLLKLCIREGAACPFQVQIVRLWGPLVVKAVLPWWTLVCALSKMQQLISSFKKLNEWTFGELNSTLTSLISEDWNFEFEFLKPFWEICKLFWLWHLSLIAKCIISLRRDLEIWWVEEEMRKWRVSLIL